MLTFWIVGGILIAILVKKFIDSISARGGEKKSDVASATAPSSSSFPSASSFPSGWDYEVFLSFRGPDTRNNFTGHLYNALVDAGIHTFIDDNELRIGEEIGPELLAAIKQSRIAIPIFSKNYASSKWCLIELGKIVDCKSEMGQLVLPIFFHVEPSEVRNQTGSYAGAFREHSKRFSREIAQDWKKSLTEIGSLKGWDLKNIENGHEGKLVKQVVKTVLSKLKMTNLITYDNLVGIQSHVEEMMKLLNIESKEIQIVGIHGVGGIGKTTIAKVVYNAISHHFDGCSFLADVRETSQQQLGLVHLQNQLISNILKQEKGIISVDEGINVISKRLRNKKVLIVLDDVDQIIQLHGLIKQRDWFGSGSRIIITTRDKHILYVYKADRTYEPSEMDADQSLQLLSKHAFERDQPPKEYLDLSKDVVKTTGGLPLALEVVGSFLYRKEKTVWKDTLKKLEKIPPTEVEKKLRISYDGLDYEEKEIFLDIACFFSGMDKNIACYIWQGCDFFPETGIEVLCLKSLVKIGKNNELRIHDQLRDLGREIVRQENHKEPGERSRVWYHEEVLNILNRQMGTRKVEGLSIDFGHRSRSQCLMSEGFAAMTRLRLLQVDYAGVAGNFVHSFSELRWLSWKGCPIEFTLTNPGKLAVLDLSHSDITESWMGWNYIKVSETLKVLNLSSCHKLCRTPEFSANLHLEVLILKNCHNLATIDESIGHLKRLDILNMYGCKSLMYLPASICELSSLKRLDIKFTRICQLPEKLGCLEALMELHVDFSNVRLPNSIGHLRNIKTLSAANCGIQQGEILDAIGRLSSLEFLSLGRNPFHSLPSMVSSLTLLRTLSLEGCKCLQSLPELSNLTNLEVLDLNGCENLVEITTINALTRLQSLTLSGCSGLQYIPQLPLGLTSLIANDCGKVREISGFLGMKNLVKVCLNNCSRLAKIVSLEGLDSLQQLEVNGCDSLRKLPKLRGSKKLSYLNLNKVGLSEIEGLEGLYSLGKLTIWLCRSLRKIPNLSDSKNLVSIDILSCNELSEIDGLEGLDTLQQLGIDNCNSLRKIQLPKKLWKLYIRHCEKLSEIEDLEDLEFLTELSIKMLPNLFEIEGLEGLYSLEKFFIQGCRLLSKIPKLSYLKNIVYICISSCNELSEIEGLEGLYSLEKLLIMECPLLRKIPNLSYSKKLVLIDISSCDELSEIEGLQGLDSLERLHIKCCDSLRRIQFPKKPLDLDIIGSCNELSEIEGLDRLYSLEKLVIMKCPLLRKIPNLSDLKNLVNINISSCIELSEIDGLRGLDSLKRLRIKYCNSLRNIQLPKKLLDLDIIDCEKLSEFEGLDSLEDLSIDGCLSLRKIQLPKKLSALHIIDCEKLSEIEGLEDVESLISFKLFSCGSIARLPDLWNLKTLRYLHICGLKMLLEIGSLEGLESLEELRIFGAPSLKVLRDISTLKNLKHLGLEWNNCMERLPDLSNFNKLIELQIEGCGKLTEIPSFDKLESLEVLRVCRWKSMEILPDLSNFTKLRELRIEHCDKLTEIQGVDRLEILEVLRIDGCISIETLPCLSNLKKLKILSAVNCKKLTRIQGVEELESLEKLDVRGCISMKLPDFSSLRKLHISRDPN